MATATQNPAAALGDIFKEQIFSKEVEGWLGRATPADRERFERVFESIRSISEAKKVADTHAGFVHSTLGKIRHGSSRKSAGPNARTPPLAHGSPAVVCNGWSYTATRSAFDRPDTRTAILSLQEQVAVVQEQQRQQQQQEVDAEIDRPQSAPSPGAGDASSSSSSGRDRALNHLQHAAERRRALSFGATTTAGHPGASGGAGDVAAVAAPRPQSPAAREATGAGFVPLSPNVTRYQETFNLHSAYPEVYEQALRDTKVEPVPNSTFISEWGNSLKSGADEAQKLYMRTTYNTLNDEVVKFKTDAEAVREREFFKWMQKQKSFYGDLLSKDKIKDLDQLLAGASDEQKHEILEAMRMTHAVADDCFDRTRSHSQAVHGPMRRMEDEATEAMRLAHNKMRNTGQPVATATAAKRGGAGVAARRPATAELKPTTVNLTIGGPGDGGRGVDGASVAGSRAVSSRPASTKALKPTRRPATAGAALGGSVATGCGGGVRPVSVPPPQRADGDKMDTFRSKVPLTWPSGSTGPDVTSYGDTYGRIGAGHVRPNSALFRARPIKYNDTSCPYGGVNPYTAAAPPRNAYPVPEGYTSGAAIPFPLPKGNTTYRNEFAPRDPADMALQLRAAAALAENGRKLLDRGSIPLGTRTGVNVLPSSMWISEMHESYVPREVDTRAMAQAAHAIRAMHMAPTGASGKMTLGGFHQPHAAAAAAAAAVGPTRNA